VKTKIFKVLSFTVVLLGIIISCQKEILEIIDDGTTDIIAARTWYESNIPCLEIQKSTDNSKGKMQAKPDWGQAFCRKHNDFKTVEVSLITQGLFGFATPESRLAYEETGDLRFLKSLTRMVILTKDEGNKTLGFLMTLIPEKEYRELNGNKVFSSSYLKWQKGFSGIVLYHNLDGSFANGWKLSKGKVVKTVKQKNGTDIDIQLGAGPKSNATELACYDYYLTTWYVDCIEWYTNDVFTNLSCGAPYSITEFLYTLCEGDGGGGDYNPPPSVNETPCEGDPLRDLRIASSGASGTMGGMFGCVRIGADPECDYLNRFHGGIDIACTLNSNVYAMQSGTVFDLCDTFKIGQYEKNSLGNYITIRYTSLDGHITDITYGHLNYVYLTRNSVVSSGQLIGLSGETGNAADPDVPETHVHIITVQDNILVDPRGYFASYISSDGSISMPCDPDDPFMAK
jgi:hypothetical protein